MTDTYLSEFMLEIERSDSLLVRTVPYFLYLMFQARHPRLQVKLLLLQIRNLFTFSSSESKHPVHTVVMLFILDRDGTIVQ